ncbi:MAG TPA: outer membrane protein assembly factor BamE [Alphaproteobacteria bacterium]|nr:outer membrane protein assembly factor BamE [Alphaproteobacteria bacterium]
MQQPGDPAPSRRTRPAYLALALAVALGLSACATPYIQGNVVDPDLLSQIKPGNSTKQQVRNLIGTPSSVSTFDPDTWYYISKETKRYGFLDPELIEEKVIEIDFDKSNKVLAIHTFGRNDMHDVEMVSRTTPTRGKSLGVVDQLWLTMLKQFGNGAATAGHPDPYMER